MKLAPARTGFCTDVMRGWPGKGVGVGTGIIGTGVVTTHIRGVGVGLGVAVWVGAGVRVGINVGSAVGVGVGLGVGVLVGLGVNVGMKVGGPVALNAIVALAAWNSELPAKLAVSGVTPAAVDLKLHEALPLMSVTPVQEFPSRVILSWTPRIAIVGLAEMSKSDAVSVLVLPTVPLLGLTLSVQKVACGPPTHVTCAKLEVRVWGPTVANATSRSFPVKVPA
jgi:hypothetical protein